MNKCSINNIQSIKILCLKEQSGTRAFLDILNKPQDQIQNQPIINCQILDNITNGKIVLDFGVKKKSTKVI